MNRPSKTTAHHVALLRQAVFASSTEGYGGGKGQPSKLSIHIVQHCLSHQFKITVRPASKQPPTMCEAGRVKRLRFCFIFVDRHASRNSAAIELGYQRIADVLSISTNIRLTPVVKKYRFTLYFYITRRQFIT